MIQYVNQKPKDLDEIHRGIYALRADLRVDHIKLSKQIEAAKKLFDQGSGPSDESIQYALIMSSASDRTPYMDAYIQYMGLSWHFMEKSEKDAAWAYYAKAQHCLGVYDSWNKVLDYLMAQDQERQHRAKGGKKKHEKTLAPLVAALTQVAIERRPTNGWKSKKELIKAALPILEEIVSNNGPDCYPLFENIEDSAYRMLRTGTSAQIAYLENVSPKNDDAI